MERIVTQWKTLPSGGKTSEHVFAIGDVHGRADLLEGLLIHVEAQAGASDAHLVFLGDLIDRGPAGLRAVRLAWDAKDRFRQRSYLAGNHEIVMLDALLAPHHNAAFQCWFNTYDGHAVCDEVDPKAKMSIDELADAITDALPDGFLRHIEHNPGHLWLGDCIFVHAGIPGYGDRDAFLSIPPRGDYNRGEHWSVIRDGFLNWTGGWDPEGHGPTIVVHGHSVEVQGRLCDAAEIFFHADRSLDLRRMNIDIGAPTYGQLLCIEMQDDIYRFHMAQDDPSCLKRP